MLTKMLLPSYCVVNGTNARIWDMIAGAAAMRSARNLRGAPGQFRDDAGSAIRRLIIGAI